MVTLPVSRHSPKKWFLLGIGSALALALALPFAVHKYRTFKANIRGRMCVYHIEELQNQMYLYAAEHDAHFPDKVSALYPEFVTDLQAFICPEIGEKCSREFRVPHPFSPNPTPDEIDSRSSYAVVPGLSTNADRDTVLAYEKNDNHPNLRRVRVNVAGRGIWDSPEQ